MVDEFKSIRDNLFKAFAGLASGGVDDDDHGEDESTDRTSDAKAARALLQAIFARAGKGKDEIVQMLAREIGMAVAAMLKEPLSQLAKNQKLQISFEFVPKTAVQKKHQTHHSQDSDHAAPENSADARASDDALKARYGRNSKKRPLRKPSRHKHTVGDE